MIRRTSRSTTRPFPGGALHRSLTWTLALCLVLGAASLQWLAPNPFLAGGMARGRVPEGLTAAAWQHIQEVVDQAGYDLSRQTATEQMSAAYVTGANQAQGWRLAFGPAGVTVTPRDADASWRWELALAGYGYAGQVQPVAAAPAMQARANRLIYHRDDNLAEWYVNERDGLEQGFTVQRRPAGGTGSGPLHIELALRSTLVPYLAAEAIHFLDAAGETVLRYDRLYVTDATGRMLPAHLELDPGPGGHAAPAILRIVVDDGAASYPIAIDPWLQMAKLTASDAAADDRFGYSVAISGDTVVVGVPFDAEGDVQAGSAYVFVRAESGWANSTETAKLTASDGADGDEFGHSVAVDGDTIVVGALNAVVDNDDAGAAYLFVRPEGGWVTATETAKLTASDGADGDKFGNSVGISGHAVLVGAPSDDDIVTGSGSGSAYLFVEPEGGWVTATQTAKLTASDAAANDNLGHAVAISGDTAVASAPYDDDSGSSSGSAYVFVRPPGGWATGTETAKLTASDGSTFDGLGESVAVSGDSVVVGAPGTNDQGNNTGAVYVFVRPESGWDTAEETARLTASDGGGGDNLGRSVTISGDTIVAGAPYWDDEGSGEDGSAYLFVRPVDGWATGEETQQLNAGDASEGDEFGGAVSVSGGAAVIGAAYDDDGGDASGSAYVFVNGFCSKASGDWESNEAWVGGAPPSSEDDVCISSGNTFFLSGDAHVRRLLISPGATLVIPAGASLTVEETVTNDGAMQQILNVNNASVAFLEIQNGDGTQTHYRGVNIDTTAGASDLGEVTVTVQELNPGEYCTGEGAGSPTYAQRCFRIEAAGGSGLVRLWGLRDELNGIAESSLVVYHYVGDATWEELVTNGSNGNDGGSYVYAEGDTPGFSAFLLGETGSAPVAITLSGLEAKADLPALAAPWLGLLALVAGGLLFGWHTRRSRP